VALSARRSDRVTASAAIRLVRLTWRLISAVDDDSSSVAVATLVAACSDAAATAVARREVSAAVAVVDAAADRSAVDAAATQCRDLGLACGRSRSWRRSGRRR
jgi:hypothetical protein